MNHPAVGTTSISICSESSVSLRGSKGRPQQGQTHCSGGSSTEFLTDGQMGVIPSLGTRVPRLLAPVPLGSLGVVLGIIQVIGAIVPRLGFGASSEEIGLELAFFAFKLFDLLLQRGDAVEGIAMTRLPISDLLAEFEILASKRWTSARNSPTSRRKSSTRAISFVEESLGRQS